jgi:hypothetical protein
MSISTTCIGAYLKPGFIAISNIAETGEADDGKPSTEQSRVIYVGRSQQ